MAIWHKVPDYGLSFLVSFCESNEAFQQNTLMFNDFYIQYMALPPSPLEEKKTDMSPL